MLRFDDLQLFVRAADLGSLSAAARVMDPSSATAWKMRNWLNSTTLSKTEQVTHYYSFLKKVNQS